MTSAQQPRWVLNEQYFKIFVAEMGAPPARELINDTSFREFMLSYCPEDSVWDMWCKPVCGADSHSLSPHWPVLHGGSGRDGEDKEDREGALQGAQLQNGYLLQAGSALPHQAPQLKIGHLPVSCKLWPSDWIAAQKECNPFCSQVTRTPGWIDAAHTITGPTHRPNKRCPPP